MEDDWVTAAFSDDALVAELICRLNQSSSQPSKPPPLLSLPLGWGHRQPRSKPKKDSSTTRCSPTTPLSWSGGSDGDYSNSNSSRPSSDLFRSKGACNNNDDAANIYFNNKRSTKKKTFTQLKEEESLLLKERVTLKRELASLHVTLKEQRVRSENFKRFKVDINLQTSGEMICRTGVAFPTNSCNQMEASTSSDRRAHSAFPRHAALQDGFGSYSLGSHRRIEKDAGMQAHKVCFALPDLNMMPSEEDIIIGPEMLNGMS